MNFINKYLISAGALMLGLAVTSCKQDQDWSTDASHNRTFGVKDNISVNEEDTQAEITFKTNAAGEYTIELANDTLYDEIAVGAAAGSKVYQETCSANKEVHATVKNLIGNTKYYLRIRAAAEGSDPSYWVYYKTSKGLGYFKTKAEQIFNEVQSSDIQEDAVRLTWDSSKEVTSLSVYKGSERKDSVILDAAAIAAGEYTFSKTFQESGEAIKPSTTYKFYIWMGQSRRGELSVATAASMPSADYKKVLEDSETLIDADMLKAIAEQAAAEGKTNYGVTIGIPAGATVDLHAVGSEGNSNLKIPDGMSVTFFGMAGGDAPTIKFQKNIDMEGSHSYIAFENVNLVNDGANYFVNQSKACTVGELIIQDATVSGFSTAFFRLQGSDEKTIGKLTLQNSVFHDMCNGYSFIHVDAGSGKGVVKNIAISNSTLYNIAVGGKMFIYSKSTNMETISVANTTFYNCIGNNNYWVDFGSADNGCSGTFEFVKCLFTKTPDEVTKNNRSSNEIVFDGCFKTADFFKTFQGCGELEENAEDIFTDPANGNFLLKKDIDCGDPRWFKQ